MRGAIVPIVDLKACFGDGKTDIAKSNVVVIVRINQHVVGLVVDAVSDILSVNPSSIQPMPELQAGGAKLVPQIINYEDRLLGVLDLNRIIDLEQLDEVAATVQ